MFLKQTMQKNSQLIHTAFSLHQKGEILPDSYVVDMDTLLENAKKIKKEADADGIRLFFMLKQLGRNPYIAKQLIDIGYEGAVVVDFKEAEVMMNAGIPIANVGHLVQVPEALLEKLIAYGTKLITVYSQEKMQSIDSIAGKLGCRQGVLLRVYDEGDIQYSGQTAGFALSELEEQVRAIQEKYRHVEIRGITSFPCYLYDEEKKDIFPLPNLDTVKKAAGILEKNGINEILLNTPSTTCIHTLNKMRQYGGNCGEPGHGLTGTTPMHAECEMEETPCVVYVSEISHNFKKKAYCYGGGYYRRSHIENALVGEKEAEARLLQVEPPEAESIDYYLSLNEECHVGDTTVMAFRYQIFVTRSDVVLVEGIREKKPKIVGIYDSLGRKK